MGVPVMLQFVEFNSSPEGSVGRAEQLDINPARLSAVRVLMGAPFFKIKAEDENRMEGWDGTHE